MMHLESLERYGWDGDGNMVWNDNWYPDDINEFLLDDMYIEIENIDDF